MKVAEARALAARLIEAADAAEAAGSDKLLTAEQWFMRIDDALAELDEALGDKPLPG
jgi:alkanesulfonate monooxygenase SsuD/methylene tetrahydromethanopterin reductase-like flavin-dependent oxidoreductase (luciferase family)